MSANIDVFSSIERYVKAKNLALKNALSMRAQLTVEMLDNLRIYYAQYLVNLLAATEILIKDFKGSDGNANQRYKENFFNVLGAGDPEKGEQYYLYLKELRNSVVHRGEDICAAAHFSEDKFPWIIAQQEIPNEKGNQIRKAFCLYLLPMIIQVELIFGGITLKHLKAEGLLEDEVNNDEISAQLEASIQSAIEIPQHTKELAKGSWAGIDFKKIRTEQIEKFTQLLQTNVIDVQRIIESLELLKKELALRKLYIAQLHTHPKYLGYLSTVDYFCCLTGGFGRGETD